MNKFVLNVAIGGDHYCRVELPETYELVAVKKAQEIAAMFGKAFECTLVCWNNVGRQIKIGDQ